MNKPKCLSRKVLTATLGSLMALGLLLIPGKSVFAEEYVVIGNAFPDEDFAMYIANHFDDDGDGALDDAERAAVTEIKVNNVGIQDLKGIEYFPNLEILSCWSNNLTKLDLSKNTKLSKLDCSHNKIKELDLSKNTALTSLTCYDTLLENLDLTNNPDLVYMDCCNKTMKKVDISNCTFLKETILMGKTNDGEDSFCGLYYDFSHEIGTHPNCCVSITSNIWVEPLGYYKMHISSSDVRDAIMNIADTDADEFLSDKELKAVKKLDLSDKSFQSVQGIEMFTELEELYVNGNDLHDLDLSKNTKLKKLSCYNNNNLDYLDLSNNKDLIEVRAYGLDASLIDVRNHPNLKYFDVSSKSLKAVDFEGCPYLEKAYKDGDQNHRNSSMFGKYTDYSITVGGEDYFLSFNDGAIQGIIINKSNFPDYKFRVCVSNDIDPNKDGVLTADEIKTIKVIDEPTEEINDLQGIEFFTELEELYCNRNSISELDISKNTKLKVLDVSDNDLMTLDVSKCTALEDLDCSLNGIAKLDLSKNKNLLYLYCSNNIISNLDLSNNTKLKKASVWNNKLTTLDVSKCPDLISLDVSRNSIKKIDILSNPNLITVFTKGDKKEEKLSGKDVVWYKFKKDDSTTYYLYVDKGAEVVYLKPTATPTAKPTTKAAEVSISLNKKTASIKCGDKLTLKATVKGTTDKVTWKSSDTKVATVSKEGKITTKMAGQTTITATVAGKSAKCVVTVLYKDVTNTKDFWYAPTNYLTAKNVVKGYDKQTKFKPANDCTRAQMVTFLWRLQGEPEPASATCKFKDVKKSDYFFKPVIWAVEEGITTGVSKTKFNPQGVCTRAQTVTFLWRMAEKPDPKTTKNKFKDVKKKDYFYKATLWASENKILAGYKDGTFQPQGKCLRRQMVTFLYKYDKFINGKG